MSEPVIEIKNLGKVYKISHEQQASVGNNTLIDVIAGTARKTFEVVKGNKLKKEKFWAIKDLSLNINQGDVVGIIGKNGSGKSTLLKILSRIVEPTEGEIIMRGSVASLLEVGTGFHPELTGRENIFFNGAILGMKKAEIRDKFDEIVAFSGIEQFLDTPVKFYSSGMYVRLAFAVAAHLEPDILVVDEVLAVGDAEFQKKCIGKMQDVASQGRTVIFVSHDMDAVESLCKKAVYMSKGKIVRFGETREVMSAYSSSDNIESVYNIETRRREGLQQARVSRVKLLNSNGVPSKIFNYQEPFNIEVELMLNGINKLENLHIDLNVFNSRNSHIACFSNFENEKTITGDTLLLKIPKIPFGAGTYSANISVLTGKAILQDFIQDALQFNVSTVGSFSAGDSGVIQGELQVEGH